MTKDSEHLQWLHDRIINVYGESRNVDFLHRFRKIIEQVKANEDGLENYLEFARKRRKENE